MSAEKTLFKNLKHRIAEIDETLMPLILRAMAEHAYNEVRGDNQKFFESELKSIDEAFFYSCECGYEGEDYECAKGYCPSCDKPIEVNLKPHLIAAPSCKSAVGENKNGQ